MNAEEKKQFEKMKTDLQTVQNDLAALKPLLKYIPVLPELEKFMNDKKAQQITLPLDEQSKSIIRAV